MASIVSSAATVASVKCAAPVQTSVAPFSGLKSTVGYPINQKHNDITTLASNGGKAQCMQVWPPRYLKKFETLSYLPELTEKQLLDEISYLLKNKWIPCLEFEVGTAWVYRENHRSPGYYDGRYWTMWKLPMYGCTDPSQVAAEVQNCKKEYPDAHIRIIGFDNVRQVQCISFIAYKPPSS